MSISLDMIFWIYKILFLILPLSFSSLTSELFEFNKLIVVYFATVLIILAWTINCINNKKFIFKLKNLDYFLLAFLATQLISTIISIEFRTSLLGYYSRWNGGLLSLISYYVLYKGYATFITKKQTLHLIKVLLLGTVIASIYAGLEHFGASPSCLIITKEVGVDCWVQDVQERVFGTFGQPNWLAAWLVGLTPLTWYFLIKDNLQKHKLIYLLLFTLYATTLYFTKSRSGALSLLISALIFWITALYLNKQEIKVTLVSSALIAIYLLLITVFIQTPWQIHLVKQTAVQPNEVVQTGTVLERGGTGSGDIRRIVWQGGINLFKKYPVFGSGVETFALGYYQTRPVEHNLTSEWNFLYNKAHNEYLNYLATTGILGFVAYISLIFYILYALARDILKTKEKILNLSLLSGFSAILLSNFFGFSTVAVNVLFFIFPAMSMSLKNDVNKDSSYKLKLSNLDGASKLALVIAVLVSAYLIMIISKYWYADTLYAKGVKNSKLKQYPEAIQKLEKATSISPREPVYSVGLAEAYSEYALLLASNEQQEEASVYLRQAAEVLSATTERASYNVKILKQSVNAYSDLGRMDRNFIIQENNLVDKLSKLAPTDASISYMKSVALAKSGRIEETIKQLVKTVEMKPNYKLARKLLAYVYEDTDQPEKAREQYEYVLQNIDPNDENFKKDLENLNNK